MHQRPGPPGLKKPVDCPAFGKRCTPMTPLGAPMVSAEGACAAYYNTDAMLMPDTVTEAASFVCSSPLQQRDRIVLGHAVAAG